MENLNENNITLDYALKNKNYEIVELLIKDGTKISNYSLSEVLKCYFFDNINFLQLIMDRNLIDCKSNKQYKFITEILKDKNEIKNYIYEICSIGCMREPSPV